jgi:hypothetical protein
MLRSREQGGPLTTHDPNKLLQKLKDLFWKLEELEPKVGQLEGKTDQKNAQNVTVTTNSYISHNV